MTSAVAIDYLQLSRLILEQLALHGVVVNTYLFKRIAQKLQVKGKERKKLSDKLRYCIKKLEKLNIIKITRFSPRLYKIEVADERAAVDLIKLADARNHPQNNANNQNSDEKAGFKQLSEQALAPRFNRYNNIWLEVAEDMWTKSKLTSEDIKKVTESFQLYLEDVSERVLLFEDENGEIQITNYKSRFLSKSYAMHVLLTAEEAFKNAIKQHNSAVFLTLTLPPVFPLKLAMWVLSFLLHRIKAYLRKQHNKTLPHFKAIEPQRSFNPHYHVIIFGTSRIMDKRQLTKYLEQHLENFLSNLGEHYKRTINKRAGDDVIKALNKYGKKMLRKYKNYKRQKKGYTGPVNWITKINVQGEQAYFEHSPPRKRATDGGQPSVWDYIKYYITANINQIMHFESAESSNDSKPKRKKIKHVPLAFYWLMRCPFYTLSPAIRPQKQKPPPAGWRFLGSYYVWQLENLGFAIT